MNSFKTDTLCSQFLQKYSELHGDIPVSFVQNMFPRIDVSTLAPVTVPQDPQLEWNPSGHGDIYTSLKTSGILDQLIEHGYLYAFISNIDNLGASLDTGILGYFISNKLSFLMEVTDRTWMDRKGGHLARHKDGRLILRKLRNARNRTDNTFRTSHATPILIPIIFGSIYWILKSF